MRRKLLIGALSLLGLLLILALAAFWYVRSGRLDLLLQRQIIAGLSQYGIRAEIGSTRLDITGFKVTLENIMLYAGDSTRPFGSVKQLVGQYSVADYFKREINLTQVLVSEPEIWIEIDEQGRSNIDALHGAPEPTDKRVTITFLTANFKVEGGKVNLEDRKRQIKAVLPDLFANLIPSEPAALEDRINHRLELRFNNASATYQGRDISNINSMLDGLVTAENADITNFKLDSDLGEILARGKVTSFDPIKYDVTVDKLAADLAHIARVFMPDAQMSGKASFAGSVSGTGAYYHAEGTIASDAISAEGFRVAGMRVTTKVDGSGTEYKATADARLGPVSGRDVTISSIRLSDATVSGKEADFDVAGGLLMGSLKSGRISISNLRARLQADQDSVTLSQLSAAALGGSVSGAATVAYSGGTSRLDIQFRSIDLNQAATLASARGVEVRGTLNGAAQLTFPGLSYEAARGRINATFDAAVSPPEPGAERLPATGRVSLVATGGAFNIEEAFVRSASTEVTATGRVTLNATGALNVSLKSEDMAEVQRAIQAFGLIPESIHEEYQVALTGPGQFTGRIEGRLAQPNVSGRVELESIQSRDQLLGSFQGDLNVTPTTFEIANASLVRPDNSRADFTVSGPLRAPEEGRGGISLRASLESLDLSVLARLASPDLADIVSGGVISGQVDLRGLPGPRGIQGTADITIHSTELSIPSAEEGEQPEKVSVPELAGKVTIENSVLNVQDMRAQVGGSTITGQGMFNLDTYAYSINAEGKEINLAQLSDALPGNVALSGQADVSVTGQGDWDEWATSNLNATIQGRNVAVNGRELGDAKLVAFTDNGLLRVEATGNVLDQQRTLAATIDLRDRRNYPVSANIEFTDAEIGPYLGLISPDLSGISGRATGSIQLSGPLQEPDRLQAVANLSKLELGGAIAGGQRYIITNQGNIVVRATPNEITLEPVTFTGEGTSITLGGLISRADASRSNLTVDGEINLRFLSSFTPNLFTTGVARVQASIKGSLDAPQLLGFVSLRDVGARVLDVPISIARGQGEIRFTANQALIENFTASTPGGGTVSLGGGAALSGLVPDRWRIEINADQVGIEYPREVQTVFDAALVLQGNQRVNVLSGNLDVRRSSYTQDITLEELITSGGPFSPDFLEVGPGGGSIAGAGPRIGLDIQVDADNTLIIRNNLVDAVGSAYLSIRGGIEEPVISGRVLLSRGTIEFREGRHEITRGVITLPGRRRADPIIDVQTEAEIGGYRVYTSFTGPLAKLQTTLRSDPELPETDVVSLILTGTVAGDRSTAASVTQTGLGLAQSLLSASLSEQVERGAQRLFGISRFSIDPLIVGRGNDPTARVTIGQRITKNLTITYSQNLTSGPSGIDRIVLVEYRISNRFSVVGFRNDRGELGFDVRVRKRF
jgi:translocation and assembly module TamB